jgi:hypothetical protein
MADFFTFDQAAMEKLVSDHHRLRLQVQNLQATTARIRRSAWIPKENLFRFTLNADMVANKADADILELDGTDTNADENVHDKAGLFTRALSGAKGLAVKVGDLYHVVDCEQEATMYYGLQVGALLTGDSTNGIDNLEAMNGDATTDSSITANNRLGWAGDDNAKTYIAWNAVNSDWDMIQVECPA